MGRSDPNSQIDLAHLAIWARRAPPGPATYLPHPTNGCPAWPSSQGACGKPGFAQGPPPPHTYENPVRDPQALSRVISRDLGLF